MLSRTTNVIPSVFLIAWVLTASQLVAARVDLRRLEKACRSGKLKECSELATLALEDADPNIRRYIVSLLPDQSMLATVAIQDPDSAVRNE